MDAKDDEWKDSDEESGPDEEEAAKVTFKPSYMLIAIDTHESMFAIDEFGRSFFANCLEACYQQANSLIMADVKRRLGIILAENEVTKAKFVDFEESLISTIKMLKELKQKSNNDLETKYRRKDDFDLADFFLFCRYKLMQVNTDVYKRTIIYITNDDNPVVPNDTRNRFKIINESQNFSSIQIDFKVITFNNNFDQEQIYSEILAVFNNSRPIEKIENLFTLVEIFKKAIFKEFRRYKYKFYLFKDDTERYVEVVINKFTQKSNIFKNMHVLRNTQQEVKKLIKQPVGTSNYECRYNKLAEPLKLNEREKDVLFETNLPVGYSLLYVAEETSKYGWIIEQPALIEKHYKEKELFFETMWQFCRDKSKCLVCARKYKKCGEIRIVELVPKYINNTRMFMAKVIPFGPEIHYPVASKRVIIMDPEEEQAMNNLVDALSFDFDPSNFRDPVIAKKRAYIKSQLLEEPMEEILDGVPSDEQLDRKIAAEAARLKALRLDATATAGTSTKREAQSNRGDGGKKFRAGP